MTRQEILKVAKPILFNTDMVQAIMGDRKTATRRAVKPKSPKACGFYVTFDCNHNFMEVYDYDEEEAMFESPQTRLHIGDYLYVRETWATVGQDVDSIWFEEPEKLYNGQVIYRADFTEEISECRWHPSIHMSKAAARIFLRVTDVRVERLQDITKDGAIAEGAETDEYLDYEEWATAVAPPGSKMITLRDYFSELWDSTVKKSDLAKYGWDANPWVWVIEFERVEVEP